MEIYDQIDSAHSVLEYLLENPASWDEDVFDQVKNGFIIGVMTLVNIFLNIPSNDSNLISFDACTSLVNGAVVSIPNRMVSQLLRILLWLLYLIVIVPSKYSMVVVR